MTFEKSIIVELFNIALCHTGRKPLVTYWPETESAKKSEIFVTINMEDLPQTPDMCQEVLTFKKQKFRRFLEIKQANQFDKMRIKSAPGMDTYVPKGIFPDESGSQECVDVFKTIKQRLRSLIANADPCFDKRKKVHKIIFTADADLFARWWTGSIEALRRFS